MSKKSSRSRVTVSRTASSKDTASAAEDSPSTTSRSAGAKSSGAKSAATASETKSTRSASRDAKRTTAQASRRERLRQQREAAERARKRRMRIITGIGALVLAGVLFVVGFVIYKNWADKRAEENALRAVQVYPPNTNANHTALKIGTPATDPNAPTLSIYEDYQCPACKSLESRSATIFSQLATSGKVNVEFRTLTFLDTNLKNDSSVRSARAAACAATVGKYKEYHDAVYANQPAEEGTGFTEEQLRVTFAGFAGITGNLLTTFQECYDKKRTYTIVNEISNNGFDVDKVTGTPTLKVNGKNPVWDYTDPQTNQTSKVAWWQTIDGTEAGWLAAIAKVASEDTPSTSATPSP